VKLYESPEDREKREAYEKEREAATKAAQSLRHPEGMNAPSGAPFDEPL
jgi:hypothetical protein